MPYNPGNVRKLNALGGKRPQATGIAILPKNGGNILATSEGSVNNYGGNKKMGLYSNVGMSYLFQNTQLTGQRLNGNMPYFWGGSNAHSKADTKSKNMLTFKMLDDGNKTNDTGTKGFVSSPYWGKISAASTTTNEQHKATSMGLVNQKPALALSNTKVIALEMWRGTAAGGGSEGPVDWSVQPGIHLWSEGPLNFKSIVIREGGKEVMLSYSAVYNKDNKPTTNTGAEGNANDQVSDSLTSFKFPNALPGGATSNTIPESTHVYWFPFPPTTKVVKRKNAAGQLVNVTVTNEPGVNARAIFPRKSVKDASDADPTDISKIVSVYFQ